MVSKRLFEKITICYTNIALLVLNTLLVFVLLNVLCWCVLKVQAALWTFRHGNVVFATYKGVDFQQLYPGMTNTQITQLLEETWSRPLVFEPFTQFKERPFHGTYINVHAAGYRLSWGQATWPPNKDYFNIFVFGGSTIFGYGLSDNETIPSQLQMILRNKTGRKVCVYNFARGHYYSTQERILFENLLQSDYIPDAALFIDGLNDFYYYDNAPEGSDRLSAFIDESNQGSPGARKMIGELLEGLSISKLGKMLTNKLTPRSQPLPDGFGFSKDDEERVDRVIARYLNNKKMIENAAGPQGTRVLFAWHPVPTYSYDLTYHQFVQRGFGQHMLSRLGYQRMYANILASGNPTEFSNLVWLGDMQKDLKAPLYVDLVHYTAHMSQMIAQVLADEFLRRDFIVAKR